MTIESNLPATNASYEAVIEEPISLTYTQRLMGSVKEIAQEVRKNIPAIIAISAATLASCYLYRKFMNFSDVPKIEAIPDKIREMIERAVEVGQRALKEDLYLSHILFCGPSEVGQEIAAKALAARLSLPFYCFDGADKGKETAAKVNTLLQTNAKILLFVSHADKFDSKANGWLSTLLCYTGSLSKKLLLCLGAPSKSSLYPDLASRVTQVIKIPD